MVFKKNLNKKDIVKIITLYRNKLKANGIDVKKIILFGSYAKANQHPWSDLDLCVISNDFGENPMDETSRINYLANDVSPLIEAHPVKPIDLAEENVSIAHDVKKYGIDY